MKYRNLIMFTLFILLVPVLNVSAEECGGIFGDGSEGTTLYLLQEVFDFIQLAVPVLVIVLTVIEFAKAVPSGKDDAIKGAFKNTVIRLIIGFVIFMLPILINFIFDLLGLYGTCGIE